MKFESLASALVASLLSACAAAPTSHSTAAAPAPAPARAAAPAPVTVDLSESDFQSGDARHRRLAVTVPVGGQLIVTLGSNPSTGHRWAESAEIDDGAMLRQLSRRFIGPAGSPPPPGRGGQEQWVLQAQAPGTTEARWAYSPGWDAGRLVWTLRLTVNVK